MAYRPHITDAQQVFTDDEIINLMPKNFIFIARLIKVENALNLIDAFGGTKVLTYSVNKKSGLIIRFLISQNEKPFQKLSHSIPQYPIKSHNYLVTLIYL